MCVCRAHVVVWQNEERKVHNIHNFIFSFHFLFRPKSGSMLLYSRKKVRYRRDGYCWKKRKDGKTTREDHMKLKVQGMEVMEQCVDGCTVYNIDVCRLHFTLFCRLSFPCMQLFLLRSRSPQYSNTCTHLARARASFTVQHTVEYMNISCFSSPVFRFWQMVVPRFFVPFLSPPGQQLHTRAHSSTHSDTAILSHVAS